MYYMIFNLHTSFPNYINFTYYNWKAWKKHKIQTKSDQNTISKTQIYCYLPNNFGTLWNVKTWYLQVTLTNTDNCPIDHIH